jgi:hypothetical protein
MNPFTRFLSRYQRDESLQSFISDWDKLEALAISVYKAGRATDEDERAYGALLHRLTELYVVWREPLARHWPNALVAGEQATSDPFASLLGAGSATAFVTNWAALQQLPAAREAINRLVVERSAS